MKASTRDKWLVGCAVFTALATGIGAWTYVAGRQDVSAAHEEGEFNRRVDSRLDSRLDSKFSPIIKELTDIGSRISKIEGWKDGVEYKTKLLKGKQDEILKQNNDLRVRLDQQIAMVRIDNPARILAVIRGEIEVAERSARIIPPQQIVDYRNAILGTPVGTDGYWRTMETVINYESAIRQSRGLAPDPLKTARPCMTTGGRMNTFSGARGRPLVISDCIVDLDTQMFTDIIFRNCVVRYRGRQFSLNRVGFQNCRFVLEIPETAPIPPARKFLIAIIGSPDGQGSVTVSTD